MATVDKKHLYKIKRLYKSGLCLREIADIFGVHINAMTYFFRKHDIPRRNMKEANANTFARKPLSFNEKKSLTAKEKELKIAGLMLYWAEGSSRNHVVDFANSDPEMIGLFMIFLRKIYRVDEKRLRVYIFCYSNQNLSLLKKYWSSLTGIPISQFQKPYVRDSYNMKFGRQMKHGLAHIRYSDKKLLMKLIKDKKKIKNKFK